MTTLNEAAFCPRCERRGREVRKVKDRDEGGSPCWVYTFHCQTELCPWYQTGWAVQTDERGNVFEREQGPRGQDKTFKKMSRDAIARGRRQVEDLLGEDLRDKPGYG